MRVFLDTNRLIDVLDNRPGLAQTSETVIDRCDELLADIYIAWHGLATAYYLLKRGRTHADTMALVDEILAFAEVAPVNGTTALQARGLAFNDFEDAMQVATAMECQADLIVTRNTSDFSSSPISAVSPDDFLARYGYPSP